MSTDHLSFAPAPARAFPALDTGAAATLRKLSFIPMPGGQGAPPAGGGMDPSMAGGAPMPPMDPAMAGGAPMPPMDPAMAGGAPMPPMDPAMAGGDPAAMAGGAPMPPVDPAMAGGAPLPGGDPAAMGAPDGTVSMPVSQLITLISTLRGSGGGGGEGAAAPKAKKADVGASLKAIMGALGIQEPAGDGGTPEQKAAEIIRKHARVS